MNLKVLLHDIKELILNFSLFRSMSHRRSRLLLSGVFLAVITEIILLTPYWLTSKPLFLIFAQIFFSFSTLLLCIGVVCFLCSRNFRVIYNNIFFLGIFCIGVWCYILLANNTAVSADRQSNTCSHHEEQKFSSLPATASSPTTNNKNSDKILQFLFTATHHTHTALAAFFPSRGNYEIEADGKFNQKPLTSFTTLCLYFLFHALVYIFASYFLISHWGYRTINRLRFWLTRDKEKNVFWCITPTPKMLQLAKDIHKKHQEFSQAVFSVEESMVSDPKALFQEMNFQGCCLKLRKPEQIHSNCLNAARNFFLTEDSDWNINMARALLARRKEYCADNFTQLYIKISDDSRELFFNRWADENNIPGKIEIIVIDEAEMIAEKFIAENPMLATLEPEEINTETATIPDSEFKVLIIGFGRIGRALLKHIICDSQFIKNPDPASYATNIPQKAGITQQEPYHSQRERVPFSADIIDCNSESWSVFKHTHGAACKRFNLNFVPMKVLSEEFFNLKWENLKNYNRIIVALGEAELNMEVTAVIENIIRKKIILPSSAIQQDAGDPQMQLENIKKRCFLVSPEIRSWHPDEKFSDKLFNSSENVFTQVGANYEIYCCENIIEEKLSFMAKLIALCYIINFHKISEQEKKQIARQEHSAQRKECGLPVIPWEYSFKEFCLLPNTQKQEIIKSWYTSYDDNSKKLSAESMYSRKSSRASAANLKNILCLLGLDGSNGSFDEYNAKIADKALKNNLGRTEHLRWIAYMLLESYDIWDAPIKKAEYRLTSAQQCARYNRHATLVEWETLPDIDRIFTGKENKTFQEKDMEIIENLPLIYKEYNAMMNSNRQ